MRRATNLLNAFYRRLDIGVDLGRKRDHSALVVVEDAPLNLGERDRLTFAPQVERRRVVRKVERIALGTQYRKVAIRVKELLDAKELQKQNIFVRVDATGVGNSVAETIREELAGRRAAFAPVVFTGQRVQRWEGRNCQVPRNELLDGVPLGLEGGLLRLPRKIPNRRELVEELRGMKRSHGWRCAPQWKTMGKHDDLVMALALAWWGSGEWPVPSKAPRVFL